MVVIMHFVPLFGEAVHIELPYIRVHILMFEEYRQNGIGKMVRVCDDEAISSLVPVNSLDVLCILTSRSVTYSILYVLMRKAGAFLFELDIIKLLL